MANITKKANPRVNVGASPWGNAHGLLYTLQTAANGGAIGADSGAAIAQGDKVRLGVIPAGSTLLDSLAVVSTAMTAAVVGDLGFEYVDGVDDAKVPQDADYFGASLALNATGRLRNATTNPPVTLPKDAWLVLTTGGAANAKASRVDVVLTVASEGTA
ncbi:hypothetical protein [Alicycliphilus denitrificans]|uniref:hypothetical protein n=1 Tax=Alicycliphilus denitrificans TaxID=179636 RepID=UPI0001DA0200|nr:hypothetical protein [Alicycliphilus denitrificans]ADU99436.1 putative phage associated protein [Alicycliphilus denitrificans BC]